MFCQLFGRALEDVKKQADHNLPNTQELGTTANVTIPEDLQQQKNEPLQENISQQNKVLSTQEELQAHQLKNTEEIEKTDIAIDYLHQNFLTLQNDFDKSVKSCLDMKRQLNEAEEILKKRDEELDSLKQILQSQQEEMKGLRAALQESKSSGRLHRSEESWKQEISQLKELLAKKEQHISRVEKKRRFRTLAHIDTLALLTSTQAALKEQGGKCALLEAELEDQQQSFQQELKIKEESFRELFQAIKRSEEELYDMCHQWEAKEESWTQCHAELEETLQKRVNIWEQEAASRKEQIQHLKDEVAQLQVICHQISYMLLSSFRGFLMAEAKIMLSFSSQQLSTEKGRLCNGEKKKSKMNTLKKHFCCRLLKAQPEPPLASSS